MGRQIIGFHGTTFEDAQKMLNGTFLDSDRDGRWLGKGIYFFESNIGLANHYAIERAARDRATPAIIRAQIDLSRCLDLTLDTYQLMIRNAHRILETEWLAKPQDERPSQRPFELHHGQVRAGFCGEWANYGLNKLDYAVVEKAILTAKEQRNLTLDTVRGIFVEEGPLYNSSWFFERAHVSIAVRPPFKSISNLEYLNVDPAC